MKKYNLTASALAEPTEREEKILDTLNKTFVDFFREVTFSLERDYDVYLRIWIYGKNGWDLYKIKLNKGNKNTIQVNTTLFPIAVALDK